MTIRNRARLHHRSKYLIHPVVHDIIRDCTRPVFGVPAAVGYLLNALGFATKGAQQTFSGPTAYLALDHENVLRDFGEVVNTDGTEISAVPGSNLVTTVADGAVLGSELVTNGGFDTDTDWIKGTGWTIGNGVASNDGSGGSGSSLYEADLLTIGKRYLFEYDVTAVTQGYVKCVSGTATLNGTSVGNYSEVLTATSPHISVRAYSSFIGSVDNISVHEVLPTILDNDGSSNDLHPYVMKSGVRDYQFYAPHATSTAYAVGDKVWAEASDGIRRWYYIDTGDDGTSGGSAPTFPTSGTVVDGTATWTYGGKYTLRGQKIEGSLTNKVTCVKANPTDTTNITDTGATTTVVDSTAALTAVGLSDICNGNVYNTVMPDASYVILGGIVGNINKHSASVWARVTSGGPVEFGQQSTARPTFSSSSFSLVKQEDTTPYTAAKNLLFINNSGSPATIQFILPGLYESAFAPDAPIVDPDNDTAASVTRSAVDIPIPTAGILRSQGQAVQGIVEPLASGQTGKVLFSSLVDSVNFTDIPVQSNVIYIRKMIDSVNNNIGVAITNTTGMLFMYRAYWTDQGMGIQVSEDAGETWSAWATNANADEAPLAATAQIGALNDASHFHGNYPQFKTLMLPTKASAAEYQSYIEDEGNWQ